MRKVAVALEGDLTIRAAQSLATHSGTEVVLLAPATSSQFTIVEDLDGCAAVFGAERAGRAGADAGVPAVVTAGLGSQAGVAWASIPGLALALAAELADAAKTAVAVPGDEAGSDTVVFPSPINGRHTEREPVDGHSVRVGRGDGPLAAALALGKERHRVIIDDHRFMEGVALAAGIAVLDDESGPTPVWERADAYLRAAADMGLVIGERVPA